MKSYEEINARIECGKAVVLTAEEIIDYVDRKGLEAAAARGGRGHHRHVRAHVLLRLLPELRAQPAAHAHHRGLARRGAGLLRGGGGGRLPGRHGAAPGRPGQHLLPGGVPLRRRARDREAGGRPEPAAARPVLRHRRLPAAGGAHLFHDPGPEPGHHGQPAQLLPELQRGRQRLRPPDPHLPGPAQAEAGQPELLLGRAAVAAAQRPAVPDHRRSAPGSGWPARRATCTPRARSTAPPASAGPTTCPPRAPAPWP